MSLADQFNPVPKPVKQRFEKICLCGKSFRVKPCHYADPTKKYCSNICRHKYARTPLKETLKTFTCPQCRKIFERALGQWNRAIKTYCGNECAHLGARKRKIIKCQQCGDSFEQKLSKIKDGSKFCNRECWKKWIVDHPQPGLIKSIDNTGKKNGQYKHGKYVGKGRAGGDTSKLKVRKQVIELDGNWCLLCGKPGPGLHLHRVVYGSQGGKYEVNNCVQLCGEHHAQVHTSKKTWFPVLNSHLLDRDIKGISG